MITTAIDYDYAYWIISTIPVVFALTYIYRSIKFFKYAKKYAGKIKKKCSHHHNRQHIAIVLLFVLASIVFIPAHFGCKYVHWAMKLEVNLALHLFHDIVNAVIFLGMIWFIEHAKDEEGGKFKYE